MGLSLFKPSGCTHGAAPQVQVREPDFSAYTILASVPVGKCTVMSVKYHNAKNFEGLKFLVYLGQPPVKLDPHFCEQHQSPIARFEPTNRGWDLALAFAENISFSA